MALIIFFFPAVDFLIQNKTLMLYSYLWIAFKHELLSKILLGSAPKMHYGREFENDALWMIWSEANFYHHVKLMSSPF